MQNRPFTDENSITSATLQYIKTALWSSIDSFDMPLDEKYSFHDLSDKAVNKAETDVIRFMIRAGSLLNGLDLETVAQDFWFTRNRHGCGFWDGDYSDDLGEKLTDLAHTFGEIALYVGDDGQLHFDRD